MENSSPQYITKVRCPQCNQKIGVKANALGKTIRCPACKGAIEIPPANPDIAPATLAPPVEVIIEESESSGRSFLAWGLCSLALLLVIGMVLYVFVLRDTWESDNAIKISDMKKEGDALVAKGQFQQGIEKYDSLTRFVGDRKLKDLEIAKAITAAKSASESAKQRIEEQRQAAERKLEEQRQATARKLEEQRQASAQKQREKENLEKLVSIESQAKAFSDSGDLQNAIEKYQQALEFIKMSNSDHPEFTQAIGRISRAKTAAESSIQAANQAAKLKEQAQQEAARKAEEAKLAKEQKATQLKSDPGESFRTFATSFIDIFNKTESPEFKNVHYGRLQKNRFSAVEKSITLDVRKTDSVISPYVATLNFDAAIYINGKLGESLTSYRLTFAAQHNQWVLKSIEHRVLDKWYEPDTDWEVAIWAMVVKESKEAESKK